MSVLAVIVQTHDAAVGQLYAPRPLDLHEEHVDGIGTVQEFEIAALESALVDLGTRRERFDALLGLARMAERAAGGGALGLLDEVHKIRWPPVDRRLKHTLRGARALDQGFVVARQQTDRPIMGQRM